MMRADHQTELARVMAYLDGELPPAEAASVRTHVDGCQDCQVAEAELRDVSARLGKWTVEAPPATLKSPLARTRLALRRWMPIAAGLVLATGAGTIWLASQLEYAHDAAMPAASPPAATPAAVYDARSSRAQGLAESSSVLAPQEGTLLARTARLTVVVVQFDSARAEVDRIVASSGGFLGNLNISGDRGSPQLLTATLRVPGAALDDTLRQLKSLGRVTGEGREAEDVTQQSADLDARLANARTSEKRLNAILANRTGNVSDVLEVEREVARVRGEIERMEAARRTMDRRINYATIELHVAEEQKARLDLGDQSLAARLRNALVRGWNTALGSFLDAGLFVAQVAPTMLLWGLALLVPYRLVRRRFQA